MPSTLHFFDQVKASTTTSTNNKILRSQLTGSFFIFTSSFLSSWSHFQLEDQLAILILRTLCLATGEHCTNPYLLLIRLKINFSIEVRMVWKTEELTAYIDYIFHLSRRKVKKGFVLLEEAYMYSLFLIV